MLLISILEATRVIEAFVLFSARAKRGSLLQLPAHFFGSNRIVQAT
jgi:hypothetical protein